jgi:hypothetical protein
LIGLVKPASPLLGFNNNVRHKGRVFHIQTEDSGVRHPHIITHLFADGGRILKTQKTSYAEFIGAPNMGEVVRQMMQEQHKAMFMALRDGQFDQLVDDPPSRATQAALPAARAAAAAALQAPAAAAVPPIEPPSSAVPVPLAVVPPPPLTRPGATSTTSPAVPQALQRSSPPAGQYSSSPSKYPPSSSKYPPNSSRSSVPPAPLPAVPPPPRMPLAHSLQASGMSTRPTPPRHQTARPRLDIDPAALHRTPTLRPTPSGGTVASIVETLAEPSPAIDLETLERAAAEAEMPFFQQINDLPPPPKAVIGARAPAGGSGGYSSVAASVPGPASTRGRYAPSRPSSIFANVRPQEGASIFGEDLISEKSLDEVILSYLAEDLDGPGDKK